MEVIAKYHQHIDNGGVTMEIEDRGIEGLVLVQSAEYYGHPAIRTEIRIDSLGVDWLRRIGTMFFDAASKAEKIDWEKRFNE